MSDDVTRYAMSSLIYRSDVMPEDELVRYTDYAALAARLAVAQAEVARLRQLLPAPHERFVRMAPEMVAQLTAAKSEPVTIAVEERPGGELFLVFTRWNTPTNPPDADIRDGIEYFQVDGHEEQQCARCGSSVVIIDCNHCGGEGTVEVDAGDGIVPDLRDVECEPCDGEGAWPMCCSSKAWCEANPMPGREHVKTTAREAGEGS